MRPLFVIAFLLLAGMLPAQPKSVGFSPAGEDLPRELAERITAHDTTSLQKVKSIFRWVTDNIAYNVLSFRNVRNLTSTAYWLEEEDDDTSGFLKPLNERVTENVLKRKTAVCDGYARLFKTLCDHAGIPCQIITGYGKTNMNRTGARFISNHKWNAVFIDTAWFLLDATWASGYINYRDEFEKAYNPYYFLTPAADFINDHYPEDMRWALLPSVPTLREFYNTPFKTTAFSQNYISSFKPEGGVIDAAVGDSVVIEIAPRYTGRRLWATDFPYADSSSILLMECCGATPPDNTVKSGIVRYTYHVTSADVQWLNVIYDDELIMRYRLNVRPDTMAPSTVTASDHR